MTEPRYLIAADTGGTFTDLAVYDTQTAEMRFGKTLTTYGDLITGVIEGLGPLGSDLRSARLMKHGTTQVINTFIQRSGARVALVTTAGFSDVLEIDRGNRPVAFDLRFRKQPPLVTRDLCFEVEERVGADGQVLAPLDPASVAALIEALRAAAVEGVAVSLLNAYRNPAHEEALEAALRAAFPGLFVTTGTALSREWGELERASTAVANAYVGGSMKTYISSFSDKLAERSFGGTLYLMGSNGGAMPVSRALSSPLALLESGPIGGCIGAGAYARALKLDRLVAFDMGGTTAKCALVEHGRFDVHTTYYVGGYETGFPIRTPVLDIVEVGAGGGSIGWLDNGRLRLGPHSAGSEPGPICFGRGGTEPTLTDANLVTGRIGSGSFLDGRLRLDLAASARAFEDMAAALGFEGPDGPDRVATGLLDLAVVTMTGAIREVTIERGRDVRDYALFVFGGGGPLFACQLAREMSIGTVVVPLQPGTFSSMGMLMAEARMDVARTLLRELSDEALPEILSALGELDEEARSGEVAEADRGQLYFERELELRYRGQKYAVRVPVHGTPDAAALRDGFEDAYRRRYGRFHPELAMDVVMLRVSAFVPMPMPELQALPKGRAAVPPHETRLVHHAGHAARLDTAVYRRDGLTAGFAVRGPAIIEEFSATTVLGPDDSLVVGRFGELVITCHPAGGDVGSAGA